MRNQAPYKSQLIHDFDLESPKTSYLIKDASYKLTSEIRTGGSAGSPTGYSIAYTYDNVGNRLTQTKDGVLTSYNYNNRDQLTNETGPNNTTYTYDHAGRMTNKTDNAGSMNYTWIDNDRMAQVSGPGVLVNYAYDYNGQRISETTAGGTKRYLMDYQLPYGQVIAETDGGGNLVAGYVYGLERISQSRGGNVHFYQADGQGSTRQLTDASGNVTDAWTFDAFGNTINRTGTTENSFMYVGESFDPNCGFYNLRARWYNPANGRFTSVDPYEGNFEAPISLHRYVYAHTSPATLKDPTGLFDLGDGMAAISISSILSCNVSPGYSQGDKAGVLQGWVQWSVGTTGLFRIDVDITFKNNMGFSQSSCEYQQKVFTVAYIPSTGQLIDTRPLHDDHYSRLDDDDGNLNDAHFSTNDNPGLTNTQPTEGINYTFAAQQFVLDKKHGNKVVADVPLHTAVISGASQRVCEGVPYIAYFSSH